MEAVLQDRYFVNGVIPSLYSAKSTAEKQAEKEEKQRLREQAKLERAEARQEKKDNKIFEDIREEIRQSLLGAGKEKIEQLIKTKEKFEFDIANRHEQGVFGDVNNAVQIADGALLAENANKRERRHNIQDAFTGIAAGTFGYSIDSIVAALTPFFPALAPYLPIILPVGGVSLILAKMLLKNKRLDNANEGATADTLAKEEEAVRQIKVFLEKLQKLDEMIERDKAILVENKKTMSKKDFAEFLKQYVKKIKQETGSLFQSTVSDVVSKEITESFESEIKEAEQSLADNQQSQESVNEKDENGFEELDQSELNDEQSSLTEEDVESRVVKAEQTEKQPELTEEELKKLEELNNLVKPEESEEIEIERGL